MQVFDITELSQLDQLAKQLANTLKPAAWVYLSGDLGTGKTTFAQRFIHYKGCHEPVISPTYAILQHYVTDSGSVIHCDLYRLSDPEELYEIGLLEESLNHQATTLVEWPEKGKGVIPQADIILTFTLTKNQRHLSLVDNTSCNGEHTR